MRRRFMHEQQVVRNDRVIEPAGAQEQTEVGEEVRATIAALMPWGISILAHVGLIVLAFFLVWQTIVKQEHQPVVPRLSNAPEVSAATSMSEEPLELSEAGGAAFSIEVAPIEPVEIKTVGFELPALPSIGESVGEFGRGIQGVGEDDSPWCIFPPLPPGSADDVVFLIDASGSMVDVLPFVIHELKQVVNGMQPVLRNGRKIDRKATVIFFSGGGVFEVPGGGGVKGLRAVSPAFKEQVQQWVALDRFNFETGGRGGVHVKDALARALSYKPDLVILLSDNLTGGGQGATQHELMQDELLKLIHGHNKANPPTRINTVQFLYEDPLVRAGLPGTLNRIAEETGGAYRFVSQRDLNLR